MQRSKYMKHKSRDILDFCCELVLPSLPGSHAWVEKKEASSYTLFQHAQFPTISENFCKICSITLTSTRHANFSCVKKMPATDHTLCGRWRRSDEVIKLFTDRNYSSICPCIPAKCYDTWLTQSFHIFPFEVDYNHLETKQLCSLAFQQVKIDSVADYQRNLAHVLTVCTRLSFLLPCTRAWERFIIMTQVIYQST